MVALSGCNVNYKPDEATRQEHLCDAHNGAKVLWAGDVSMGAVCVDDSRAFFFRVKR